MQKSLLKSEAEAVKALESQYKRALSDINRKVKDFQAEIDLLDAAMNQDGLDDATRALLQSQRRSKIYQKQYQEALKGQISGILDKMQGDNYSTIEAHKWHILTIHTVQPMQPLLNPLFRTLTRMLKRCGINTRASLRLQMRTTQAGRRFIRLVRTMLH